MPYTQDVGGNVKQSTMELVDSRPGIRNGNILWLILGIFLFPMFHSLDSLIYGFMSVYGLSFKSRFIVSTAFQAFVILGVSYVLLWVYKNWTKEKTSIVLTLKTFKVCGFILLLIIVSGRTVSFFNSENMSNELKLLTDSDRDFVSVYQTTYLSIANTLMRLFRDLILFIVFFVIVFKNKD